MQNVPPVDVGEALNNLTQQPPAVRNGQRAGGFGAPIEAHASRLAVRVLPLVVNQTSQRAVAELHLNVKAAADDVARSISGLCGRRLVTAAAAAFF